MRNRRILWASVLLVVAGVLVPAQAEPVTREEAVTVAQNWITLIIEKQGAWGGAPTAQLNGLYDLRRGDRPLGYLFRVQPQGYILVPLRSELPPVQAYSDTGDFDPASDTQGEGIIKEQMTRLMDGIEGRTRPQLSIQSQTQPDAAQAERKTAWETLKARGETFATDLHSGKLTIAYESGNVLLTSAWNQDDPYNRKCPTSTCSGGHCPVGCTPLAGAQVMRYWAWPPGYDWANMPDKLDSSSSQVQIDAVATLCRDLGDKAGAWYCVPGFDCETFCQLVDDPLAWGDKSLQAALFDNFSYHDDICSEWRNGESAATWFGYFKDDLNLNRPVLYELGTGFHTVVCDGWQEVNGMRQLHLNYGWGGAKPDWWTLDTEPDRGELENIIKHLHPNGSVGTTVMAGKYTGFLGLNSYIYFDQDASTLSVVPGGTAEYISYDCQFLPGVTLITYPVGARPNWGNLFNEAPIKFSTASDASPGGYTRLHSIKGTQAATIQIKPGGALKLQDGGRLRFF